MVNLKGIELATEEDKAFRIDDWARLFKAETWEELRMLAGDNEYLQEAAEALYVANADEIVRQQCQAREDAEKRERTLVRDKKSLESRVEELRVQCDKMQDEYDKMQGEYDKMQGEYDKMQGEYDKIREENAKLQEELFRLRTER